MNPLPVDGRALLYAKQAALPAIIQAELETVKKRQTQLSNWFLGWTQKGYDVVTGTCILDGADQEKEKKLVKILQYERQRFIARFIQEIGESAQLRTYLKSKIEPKKCVHWRGAAEPISGFPEDNPHFQILPRRFRNFLIKLQQQRLKSTQQKEEKWNPLICLHQKIDPFLQDEVAWIREIASNYPGKCPPKAQQTLAPRLKHIPQQISPQNSKKTAVASKEKRGFPVMIFLTCVLGVSFLIFLNQYEPFLNSNR